MELERLERLVGWIPLWSIGSALLILAGVVAYAVHGLITRLLHAIVGPEPVFLRNLLARTRRPSRAILIIFALGTALNAPFFTEPTTEMFRRTLLAGFIGVVGWIAVIALDIAGQLYLRRYRLDVEDNLLARKHVTQIHMLRRAVMLIVVALAAAAALMTFPSVRQYGVSLLAAGGAAGVIVGLAAQPILSNLFAGLQLALTQPIRIDDAVIVEGEWGTIEDITSTYVVIKIWDWRRLVVPLKYFIEKPFQNWTRETSALIGVVTLHVDYSAPVEAIRKRLEEIAAESRLWDKRVVNLQVVEAYENTIQLRALISARSAPISWDLRCEVREKLIDFIQTEFPHALPRGRASVSVVEQQSALSPASGPHVLDGYGLRAAS